MYRKLTLRTSVFVSYNRLRFFETDFFLKFSLDWKSPRDEPLPSENPISKWSITDTSHWFSLSCVSKLNSYLNSDRNSYSIYHTKLHRSSRISHSISSILPLFWSVLVIIGVAWMALSSSIKERQFIESSDRWQGLVWTSGLWRLVMDEIFERKEFWKM